MKKEQIKELLMKAITDLHEIDIKRYKIDENPIDCIPLYLNNEFLLIQYLYDFEFDGYKIIRIKDIASIKTEDSIEFCNKILKKEGIINQAKLPKMNIGDNWEDIFKELKSIEKNIIIECEDKEQGEFYIGKILDVYKHYLLFLYFNGMGEWDKDPTKIDYKFITSTSFDTRYINVISKYLNKN